MYYLPAREILARTLSSQRKCTEVDCETRRSWKEQKVTNVFFSSAAFGPDGEHWILLLCRKMMGRVCAS